MTASIYTPGGAARPVNPNTTLLSQVFNVSAAASNFQFALTSFTYTTGVNALIVFVNGVLQRLGTDFTEDDSSHFTVKGNFKGGETIVALGFVGITATPSVPSPGTVVNASLNAGFILGITNGGTGGTDGATARSNLSVPSQSEIQKQTYIAAVASGTADAITATFTPAIAAYSDGLCVVVRATAPNATTIPTFTPTGLATPKTIVKGNNKALQVGDISGIGHWLVLVYHAGLDVWVLQNPATPLTTDLFISSINGFSIGGMRNRIINGDMRIDQRNKGALVNNPSTYILDRWYINKGAHPAVWTVQQSTDAPVGFVNSLQVNITTAGIPGASDYAFLRQGIEGYNISDLGWGTANAKYAVVSFLAKASIPGIYAVTLQNSNATRTYVTTVTVNAANTWEYKSIVVPGDTAGTWATDNSAGLYLVYDLGTGSNQNTSTLNAWQSVNVIGAIGAVKLTNTAGAKLNITGVKIEPGIIATIFDKPNIVDETIKAQRYYEIINVTADYNAGVSATGLYRAYKFAVTKRAAPSLTLTNFFYYSAGANASFSAVAQGSTVDMASIGVGSGLINANGVVSGVIAAVSEL